MNLLEQSEWSLAADRAADAWIALYAPDASDELRGYLFSAFSCGYMKGQLDQRDRGDGEGFGYRRRQDDHPSETAQERNPSLK